MAKLNLVGIKGVRIVPERGGYPVLGEYKATLPAAIRYAQGLEVPEEDDVNASVSAADYEDPQEVFEDRQRARERRANYWLDKHYPI